MVIKKKFLIWEKWGNSQNSNYQLMWKIPHREIYVSNPRTWLWYTFQNHFIKKYKMKKTKDMTFGEGLIQGLQEAIDYVNGDETKGTVYIVDSETDKRTKSSLEEGG